MKQLALTIIFLANINALCAGTWWSKPQQTQQSQNSNPHEPIIKEFRSYLETMKLESIKTRKELEKYVETTVNRDLYDPKKFPLLNTHLEKNARPSEYLVTIIQGAALDFANKKCAELKLEQ